MLEHNVSICSAAVSAFEKGQRPQKEKELISGMRQCLLEPNVITYSAAISDYEKRAATSKGPGVRCRDEAM